MARWIRGAMNAYSNQMNWQDKHEGQLEADKGSFLGLNRIVPRIRNGWNHLMVVPSVVEGFFFGEEIEEVPEIKYHEINQGSTRAKNSQELFEMQREQNENLMEGRYEQIMGMLTLNMKRFNAGTQMRQDAKYISLKDDVIMPGNPSVYENNPVVPSETPGQARDQSLQR